MKINRKTIFILLSVLVSCTNNGELDIKERDDFESMSKVFVYQERDKDYPLTDYRGIKSRFNDARAITELSFKDFIGCSFKLDFYPYENAQNLGFPVINVEQYLSDHPTWYHAVPVKDGSTNYYSYTDFERYEVKTNKTKTVKSGFKLDFKIFSIGSSNTYKETFKSSDVEEKQRVFGELSVKFYDKKYELMIPDYVDLEKYVCVDFKNQLYHGSIDELMKNYGGFVLTKFLSGGQAIALYNGLYKSNIHEEEKIRENSMDSEINVSYSLEDSPKTRDLNNTPSQSLYIGKKPNQALSFTNKFQELQFSIRTLGGIPAYSQFSLPKDINSVVMDLSAWCASLSDEKNLTIAELIEDSFIPISDFIEEDNLKESLYRIYKMGTNTNIEFLKEPKISVQLLYKLPYEAMGQYETRLMTRYGEHIVLKRTKFSLYDDYDDVVESMKKEAARISTIFPYLKTEIRLDTGDIGYLLDDINQFDIDNMKKYVDPENGKVYILTNEEFDGRKRAYTLYDENVINDYTLKEIINHLPIDNTIDRKTIIDKYYKMAL